MISEMNKLLFLLLTLVSANVAASVEWKYNLPSGDVATVSERTNGGLVSYILTAGKLSPLLLLKVNKYQKMGAANTNGFPKITDQNTANRRLLFRLSFKSSASGSGRGQCGAGIEDYLFIVEVDKAKDSLSTLTRLPLESCWSDISLSAGNDSVQVFIEPERNESTLRIKYAPHPRSAKPLTVTYSLDNEFFNIETSVK